MTGVAAGFREGVTGLVIALVLGACAGPNVKILDRPVPTSETAEAIADSREQAAGTIGVLREEGLTETYEANPGAAIGSLAERYARHPTPARRRALGEMLSDTGQGLENVDRDQALGYYLDGARICEKAALKTLGAESSDRTIYNYCVAQVVRLLHEEGFDGRVEKVARGALRSYRLDLARDRTTIDLTTFDLIVPVNRVKLKGLEVAAITQGGFGVAMVGHQEGSVERIAKDPLMQKSGYAIPMNAFLRFSGSRVSLVMSDLMLASKTKIAGRSVPLAANYTVPLGMLVGNRKIGLTKVLATLRPSNYENTIGLYLIEPFREDKIPLVLVHGLLSTAEGWMPFANLLRADPVLRDKYQLLFFNYPTGHAIGKNAKELREALREFQRDYDPDRSNPKMREMVIIGHSMGGMLSNMQIRDSGKKLERLIFVDSLEELDVGAKVEADLKPLIYFSANRDISRAIFIATPHRGSGFATNPLGQIGAWLIRMPFDFIDGLLGEFEVVGALTTVAQEASQRPRNSVSSLRPDNPLLPAILDLPVKKGLPIHSIIAQRDATKPKEEGSDGVVPYSSAHLEGVVSEKVVLDTNHRSVVEDEECVREVLRILYKHVGLSLRLR